MYHHSALLGVMIDKRFETNTTSLCRLFIQCYELYFEESLNAIFMQNRIKLKEWFDTILDSLCMKLFPNHHDKQNRHD